MKTCKNCKHYKRSERIGVKCCEFGLHESYCEKDKEDFAIEELEKIKAEIMSIGNWREHYEMPIAYLSCLTIVEHHISELKGE